MSIGKLADELLQQVREGVTKEASERAPAEASVPQTELGNAFRKLAASLRRIQSPQVVTIDALEEFVRTPMGIWGGK